MTSSKRSGLGYIEALVAATIIGVSLVALINLWTVAFNQYTRTGEVQMASQLARAELERCKAFGVDNLPLGSVSGSTAAYTGSFDISSNTWVSGTIQYYSYTGARLSDANADGVRFSLTDTISDADIQTTSTSYGFSIQSKRAVVVTVTVLPAGAQIVKMGTNVVKGGL